MLLIEKLHWVIEFNQEAWIKLCINMNTKLRTKDKANFEKDFFKLKNNPVFGWANYGKCAEAQRHQTCNS